MRERLYPVLQIKYIRMYTSSKNKIMLIVIIAYCNITTLLGHGGNSL